jgi:quaternary ammonium compound-resistance protein SugE
MAWVYLILAGLCEIGWPVGLKMAQQGGTKAAGIAVAVTFMAVSGLLLYLAQKQIPIGTFLVGVLFYGDPASQGRLLGVAMIVAGVAMLKLAP